MGTSLKKTISFGKEFGDVAVSVNGTTVEVHADGSVDAYTDSAVKVHPAANDGKPARPDDTTARISRPVPGDRMPDGTIYAGDSPDTGKPMYTTPVDAPLAMTFNEASKYAKSLDAQGHQDWRLPTKAELNVLFNNRAAIGGFNVSGSDPAGWYWSGTQVSKWNAWDQRFSDGFQDYGFKDDHSSVRCVR